MCCRVSSRVVVTARCSRPSSTSPAGDVVGRTRSRLSDRLSRGSRVGAHAGVGAGGVRQDDAADRLVGRRIAEGRATAWLSLDRRDNDPALFWTYLVAALQTAAPEVGAGALALLQSSQSPIDAVLATLLNDLSAIPNDVVLVLDDYHVIEAPDIQDGDGVPAWSTCRRQVRLVIASRADPALPLARLRARGELVEIRAADLRFTPDEAAAYLNEMMGLDADGDRRRRARGAHRGLDRRAPARGPVDAGTATTWPASSPSFAGDDRYIVDYLVGEVLQRQPEDVRTFLLADLRCSSRLNGSLCDAVTGQDGGQGHARGARSRRTCSSSRSTTAVSGIATTISSPTCCERAFWTSSPTRSRTCTAGRATGTSSTATGPRRSATRWPARTSTERQT